MQLKEIMQTNLSTVTKDCTLKEAANLMRKVETGILPVVEGEKNNPSKTPIGILTDRDIVVRCISDGEDPNTTKVSDAYTPDTIFCHEDDTVKTAFEKMRAEDVGRILIKGKNDELTGIVSMADVISNASQQFGNP